MSTSPSSSNSSSAQSYEDEGSQTPIYEWSECDEYDYHHSPPPKSKTKTKTSPDRLSALPDAILLHILSFLPMHLVTPTAALSKRWQYLWTSIPNLTFLDPYTDQNYERHFARFVDRTLVLCGATKINNFVIDFKYDCSYKTHLDLWVAFALKNHAHQLSLHLHSSFGDYGLWNHYELPQFLYTNSLLSKLTLSQCFFHTNALITWTSLNSLTIGYVKMCDHLISNILSGAPVLEYLELSNFSGISFLNIDTHNLKKLVIKSYYHGKDSVLNVWAPKLQSLEILGCFGRNKCVLANVVSLVEANLNFNLLKSDDDDHEANVSTLNQLLLGLHHVHKLTIGTWCIQVLLTLEKVGQLAPLSNRKYLTLDTRIKKQDLFGILNLLESSPHLQTLIVNMDPPSKAELYRSIDLAGIPKQKRNFSCLSLHLKLVKIVNFAEGCSEYELVQFLLENAEVLEKMVIYAPRMTSADIIRATKKLLSYRRASPHAVIFFQER